MLTSALDSHFEIGASHDICQDYALTGTLPYYDGTVREISYGIICDGCSSSKHVDLGARYLAMSTIDSLKWFLNKSVIFPSYSELEHKILEEISNAPSILTDNNGLDSTLILFINQDNLSRVYFYGDGSLILNQKDTITIIKLEYTSNAPFYLSYLTKLDRALLYTNQFGGDDCSYIVKTSVYDKSTLALTSTYEFIKNATSRYSVDVRLLPDESLSIFSDGIDTFFGNTVLDESEQLDTKLKYVKYPQSNGEYVLRNMKFNKKVLSKQGINHYDDLSVASLILKDI